MILDNISLEIKYEQNFIWWRQTSSSIVSGAPIFYILVICLSCRWTGSTQDLAFLASLAPTGS